MKKRRKFHLKNYPIKLKRGLRKEMKKDNSLKYKESLR